MAESVSTIRVRYVETDQMGVVHHSAYFAWMEIARTDLLRERGVPYKQLEERGIRMPVLSVQARYLRPARYDDDIRVTARLVRSGMVRFSFEYDMVRAEDGALLCRARTDHVATDLTGRPVRLPRELARQIGGPLESE